MKNNKIIKNLFTLLFATGLIFTLTACGSDDAPDVPTDSQDSSVEDASGDVDVNEIDVYQDLQDLHAVVSQNLEVDGTVMEQIMLADDVSTPEMKYGMLVVPFYPSDSVMRHTRTVDIDNGNFTIEVVSAETGLTWTIDQDGVIAGGE